ncbi:peptidyl-glycine alpha-amidating monooxygenase B isoform X1 [Patella vulgata]|uniref:peptidyl-glycine alpha-amidating monooxygenase B isoform X1 n=1 Tax=Patella vulgata TaxID=6465 RepID=UPI00218076F2|nr:peptidyl-glycine alpha-amidating monooxygenase B isoform X1 [Patella vulgata]
MEFSFGLVVLSLFISVTSSASLVSDVKSLAHTDNGMPSDVETIELRMKKAIPNVDDAYLCASYEMPDDEVYIIKYEAIANASTAHHILLYGCSDGPAVSTPTWDCPPLCKGNEQIMFAWAKNAPPTVLPKDVGFRVGGKGESSVKNIVLQIHYAHSSTAPDESGIRIYLTRQKQKYVAGIFLMMSYRLDIPPNTPVFHADISCKYFGETSMHPFAYRTHAHDLGRVITGYQYNTTYHLIGKGNPQWPQAFYPTNQEIEIKPGDSLIARCTFNSTGRDRRTYAGATGKDEMCNFYMMFYTDSSVTRTFSECGGSHYPNLVQSLPADSDKPLPPNPLLDEKAGHHHHHPHTTVVKPVETPTLPPQTGQSKETDLIFESQWPNENVEIGQVSGVATDDDGLVYVFHRGSRQWDQYSFDIYNQFQQKNDPIKEEAIIVFSKDGKVLRSFGSKQFFMPHGLAVDKQKNIWVTDVGLHQVLRFPPGKDAPDLVLGEKFVPKTDEKHFCKPTDIAVLSNGDFYVSDGYCNGRIMKFSANGTFIKQFGHLDVLQSTENSPGAFDIPHSLTLAENEGLVCVADRENGRIQCFDLEGNFRHQIKHKEFGDRLFALEYSPIHDGILFAINGPAIDTSHTYPVQGFTLNLQTGDLLQIWNRPKGLSNPHDIAVNPSDHSVYVGELDDNIWKFAMQHKDTIISSPEKKELIPVLSSDSDVKGVDTEKSSSVTPSIVLGVLLVVPVVLVVMITILVRMYHSGKCGKNKGNKVFNLQSFFNSHKGFDRLSTEESDHELDPFDGSDEEEYTAPAKQKQRT